MTEGNSVVTYDEALKESVQYFDGDELAAKVFLDKYALHDNSGNLLEKTPTDMHRRIAKELARIEKSKFKSPMSEEEIFAYLDKFKKIVPQGSPMYGIGNPYQYVTLSNCYVLASPLDSYADIHRADEELSHISKRRGGVGLDLSNLRPAGSPTKNSSRNSSGIIPFIRRYSNSIREVGQDGRRGALMITLSVHHPQVLDFANIKRDLGEVTGANLSIKYTDEFLKAVANNTDYEQRFPVDSKTPIISIKVSARKVWDDICSCAHFMAEPGILFIDNIIKNSPADCYSGFETVSTNPCAELPLCPYDSCRLLFLNLFTYIKNIFTKKAYFDFIEFFKDAVIAQRFMDDIVDLELECIKRIIKKVMNDPEPDDVKVREISLWKKIYKKCESGRRTGTGVTAIGDVIAGLRLKYGSKKSIALVKRIYKTLKLACYRSSVDMAKELGPFPEWNYEKEKDNEFLLRIKREDSKLYSDMKKYGRRNIALLTTAPVGSGSILTQTSSGIEPLFTLSFIRRKKINPSDKNATIDFKDDSGDCWQEFKVLHPKLKLWMEVTGEKDIKKSPWWGSCAEDLDWKKRVELQSKAQMHVDHSISSTLNLPETVTVDRVKEIYETAWRSGCKGITIYRKNCRTGVLIDEKKINPIKRPKELPCDIYYYKIKDKELFVAIGLKEGKAYEIFAGQNKKYLTKEVEQGIIVKLQRGHYKIITNNEEVMIKDMSKILNSEESALTRMVSISLRHSVDVSFIVQQLEKVEGDFQSLAKCLIRALKSYIKDGTKVHGENCSSCGNSNLIRSSGCITCVDCGWSKCG